MSSGSRCSATEARQATPSGITWPSGVVCESCTMWYSPATTAVRYVEIRGVGANRHTEAPGSDDGPGGGVAELDSTTQPAGAVTVNANVALRSGCSKVAYRRRASGASKCVYR